MGDLYWLLQYGIQDDYLIGGLILTTGMGERYRLLEWGIDADYWNVEFILTTGMVVLILISRMGRYTKYCVGDWYFIFESAINTYNLKGGIILCAGIGVIILIIGMEDWYLLLELCVETTYTNECFIVNPRMGGWYTSTVMVDWY